MSFKTGNPIKGVAILLANKSAASKFSVDLLKYAFREIGTGKRNRH